MNDLVLPLSGEGGGGAISEGLEDEAAVQSDYWYCRSVARVV